MAARECWIYGECLKIRMMVPGAAAPGKQPGKQRHSLDGANVCCNLSYRPIIGLYSCFDKKNKYI